MAGHPFLKSIQPVNLLSFGPKTEPIELRPLNILIGPNASGKSNLIEILGLLSRLPDKDPWSTVIQTGGAKEWIWKGKDGNGGQPTVSVVVPAEPGADFAASLASGSYQENKGRYYSITLREAAGRFLVLKERFLEFNEGENPTAANLAAFDRDGDRPFDFPGMPIEPSWPQPQFYSGRSVLSTVRAEPMLNLLWPRMRELSDALEQFAFYKDWTFGQKADSRQLQPVGLDSYRLAPDSSNLAQVLKAMRDRGDSTNFERLLDLMRKFYEPVKDVDTELVGTHLRIMIKEEELSSRTPAERLSDGTLRWLMLLIILLDPTPPPVICIDEPELGLHPDAIHTLADLLMDASTRTQLVVTTHSTALVDAFSEQPDAVCVCEKVDGATQIRRLDKEKLQVWLNDYSLGHLWASGEIGGNRW